MNLIFNDEAVNVPLISVLSQKALLKIRPEIDALQNTQGVQDALGELILSELEAIPALFQKVDLTKGAKAFDEIREEAGFMACVQSAVHKVQKNILDFVRLTDENTIKHIIKLFKACIDVKKITSVALKDAIETPADSDFWQDQDLNLIIQELRSFRQTVLQNL